MRGIRRFSLTPFLLVLAACNSEGVVNPDVRDATLTLTGEAVIRHATLPEIGRILVIGTRTADGGCSYIREVKLGPENPGPIFESLVEYDPATCRYIFAQHDPALAPTTARQKPGSESLGDGGPYSPAMSAGYGSTETIEEEQYSGGGGGGAFSITRQVSEECTEEIGAMGAAVQRLWTEDPIHIRVTESEHFVEYSYHPGLCVNWMRSTLKSEWYETSGWFLLPWDHIHLGPGWYSGVQAMAAEGQQTMRNDDFCPGEDNQTESTYVNHIRAWEDGWPTFIGGGANSGGCSTSLIEYRYYSRVY